MLKALLMHKIIQSRRGTAHEKGTVMGLTIC